MKIKQTIAFEKKDLGENGTFSGYANVFNVIDSQRDVVKPGAFTRTLAEAKASGDMPALLWQHCASEPIGVITALREDAKGLYVEGQLLLDVQRGREAYSLLKSGAIKGMSIGFATKDSVIDSQSGTRQVLEVDLYELSLVTFPANDAAQVTSVKEKLSKGDPLTERELERVLTQDAGFSRSQARALMRDGMKGLNVMQDADGLSECLTKAISILTR